MPHKDVWMTKEEISDMFGLPEATIPMALATARLCLAQKRGCSGSVAHRQDRWKAPSGRHRLHLP